MTARSGLTQDGKQSSHALSITGQRRFLVIEFDQGDVDDHAALLWHLALKAPLAMIVHSGSKSLHGWFFCAGQPEERLRQVMRYCVSLGADRATWTRSQFVRMPDGTAGERQTPGRLLLQSGGDQMRSERASDWSDEETDWQIPDDSAETGATPTQVRL